VQKPFDLSVYFVADPALCAGRDVIDVVMAAVAGGVRMVQYRNKSGLLPESLAQAAMLAELLKPHGIPLIINDNIDIAFAVEAAGVHLGQGDAPPVEARARLGQSAIIGQTAFTESHIMNINKVVDYIGTGPFYETKTDKGKPVLGAERFSFLARLSRVPVVGIGGITPVNAGAVIKAGADGVAMMRAISEAEDPARVARAFVQSVSAARGEQAA
jgi:thiamine-phosphate pyrophosphorylase